MDSQKSKKREARWGALAVPHGCTKEFEALLSNLSFEGVKGELLDIEEKLSPFLGTVFANADFHLSSFERAYEYAFNGDLSGYLGSHFHSWRDGAGERLRDEIEGLYQFKKILDVFGADYEIDEPLRLIALINTFCARTVLDRYRLMGFDGNLSIQEIALLAGMKMTSVRNAASPSGKTPLETQNTVGLTYVRASEAHRWLSARRGFQTSMLPDIDEERRCLGEVMDLWMTHWEE